MTMKYEIFLLLFIVIGLVSAGTVEWELKDGKTTCVKVKFEGNLTVYNSSKNAMSFDVSKINSTIENGTCSGVAESTQNMTADLSKHGKLKFFFTRSKDKMVSLILQYTFQSKELFPDGTDNETVTLESGLVYGGIPATNAFRCYHMEEVNLTDTKSNYSGNLNTSDVTVQAFDIKDGKFGPADVCGDDKTSTSTASSTTAMSTTVAPPVMTTYSLKEKNKTCILLSAAIQFEVQYTTKDNKTGHGVFDIPENVTVTGACATNGSAMMVLSFGGGSRLALSFTDDTKQKMSIIKEISTELDITKAIFPDAKNQTLNGSDEMKATFSDNTYYICLAGSTVMMKNISVSLGSGWKAQAFNLKNGNFSGEGDHCPADKSSSTTASTPITTPMPNPVNNYTVHGENNTICIFMKASMEFNVTYASTKQNMSKMVYIPSGAKASGNCKVSDDVESMTITFNDEMNAAKNEAELNLVFVMDKNNKYTISNFTLTMNSDVLPGAKMNETVVLEAANVNMFQAAKDGSYLCNSPTTVALSNNEKNATMFIQANLMVKDLKYKAFNSDNSTSFKDVVECSADNSTNSIVPIAVGAALAGLVIIVLIAYLIGRRRSKRYGYESV